MLRRSLSVAALALAEQPLSSFGFADLEPDETPIPFAAPQVVSPNRPMVQWDKLNSWITPNEQLYVVQHYGVQTVDAEKWSLQIDGLVEKPKTFTLDEIKKRPKREVMATIECGGNSSNPAFMGAVGNIRWGGTLLAPLLKECDIKPRALEVVFYGADEKKEKVREQEIDVRFSRSLSIADALQDKIMLVWEMNGEPLSKEHGFPLRLIVPGWYGIAWVKWLSRIHVLDRRFMSKYMGREYVTIRGEEHDGHVTYNETSVSFMNVKSVVARVTRLKDGTVRVTGAAWSDGTPIKTVELKIDDRDWFPVTLDMGHRADYCWTFWSYDWKNATDGEHTLVSRATDADSRIQPSADDPAIKLKKTYWEANQQWPRKIKLETAK
jgi:DMSO/TMAO reductase YedYZ molybdopterin-dependent catalytic subunit